MSIMLGVFYEINSLIDRGEKERIDTIVEKINRNQIAEYLREKYEINTSVVEDLQSRRNRELNKNLDNAISSMRIEKILDSFGLDYNSNGLILLVNLGLWILDEK